MHDGSRRVCVQPLCALRRRCSTVTATAEGLVTATAEGLGRVADVLAVVAASSRAGSATCLPCCWCACQRPLPSKELCVLPRHGLSTSRSLMDVKGGSNCWSWLSTLLRQCLTRSRSCMLRLTLDQVLSDFKTYS